MGEVLCIGSACPLHRQIIQFDREDHTHVHESWCLGQVDLPIFLFSVIVKEGSGVAFEPSIECEYPPLWVKQSE